MEFEKDGINMEQPVRPVERMSRVFQASFSHLRNPKTFAFRRPLRSTKKQTIFWYEPSFSALGQCNEHTNKARCLGVVLEMLGSSA